MLHPIYDLPIRFWDKEKLLEEAQREKENSLVWKTFEIGNNKARPVWNPDETPEGVKAFDKFKEMYGDVGEVSACYLYIDEADVYDWHMDNGPMTQYGGHYNEVKQNNKKLTLCSINIVLMGEENFVEFEGIPNQFYEAALFNTSHRHKSDPQSDKIIFKFSFKEKEYAEVLEIIQNGPIDS